MNEHELRLKRVQANLKLEKLPLKLKKLNIKVLGSIISNFIHHVFKERVKSDSLNWCFGNIKRVKIFLQIFHANQEGKEIYKEEIAKNLSEYSYKTIAKIIDEGIIKKHFILLATDGEVGKDTKIKNIRPSEELITDFLNISLEIMSYIDNQNHK